jgi:hypothetical protein
MVNGTSIRLTRANSWSSNNGTSQDITYDKSSHSFRNNKMDSEIVSKDSSECSRGRSECAGGKLVHNQQLAKTSVRINSKKNIGLNGTECTNDNGSKEQATHHGTKNAPSVNHCEERKEEINSGDDTDEDANVGGDKSDRDEISKNIEGGSNGKGQDEMTGQSTAAFDEKVLQNFAIDFKIRSTPAARIGFIHKEFIKEVLMVAPSTKFVASNKQTIPTPAEITTVDQFPLNHLLHQKFFH